VYVGSFLPISSLPFVAVCVLNDSHSVWGEMESQCHLYFLYGQGC
jgi:hypothetical protein